MRLLKYIGKIRIVFVFLTVVLVYSCLLLTSYRETFSVFQHPFLTILVYTGYLFLILPFDFAQPMVRTRFCDRSQFVLRTVSQLTQLSAAYFALLFAAFLVLGSFLHDLFLWERTVCYVVYTFLSLLVYNAGFVILSELFSSLLVKIFSFLFAFLGFGLTFFAGNLTHRINFLFFNWATECTVDSLISSALTYTVLAILFYHLSCRKGREL